MRGGGIGRVGTAEVRERYGVEPGRYPTSSPCAATPPTGYRERPGSAPRRRPSCCAPTARSSSYCRTPAHRAAAGADLRPRTRGALLDNERQLLAFKEIATLQEVKVKRPPDTPTDHAAGAKAAEALGMRRLAERLRKLSGS